MDLDISFSKINFSFILLLRFLLLRLQGKRITLNLTLHGEFDQALKEDAVGHVVSEHNI